MNPFIPSVTVNGETFQPDPTFTTSAEAIAAVRAGIQPASRAISHLEANRLLDHGYLDMETGYSRLDNGMLYIAALTDMPGVTGAMSIGGLAGMIPIRHTHCGTLETTLARFGKTRLIEPSLGPLNTLAIRAK
jgi:hypothetical protein